jgi:integrase
MVLTNTVGIRQNWDVKKPILKVRPYHHSKTHKFILDLRAFGKGRFFFKTRAEADAECLRQRTLLERHSREAVGLQQREMSDFITARNRLREYGKTVNDATDYLINFLGNIRRCKITVAELAAEVIEAKKRDGKSAAYLADLRKRLSRFSQDFGDRPIASITIEELDKWLRDLPLSPKSRANYRANVGVVFSFAKQRRMIDVNPVEFTAKPKLADNPPEIFTVDELRALLDTARRIDPDVVPMLAIGAFAGLRDAEIKRLHWDEVKLARGFIELKAAKAKSAKRRIVPIQPNLAAWLQPYSSMTGRVVPVGARGKIERVRKDAGLTNWPQNGLRHSYASYRLAATHDAPRVGSELGHASPQMLYSTYREVVTPEEATRYWQLMPDADEANLVQFSRATAQ